MDKERKHQGEECDLNADPVQLSAAQLPDEGRVMGRRAFVAATAAFVLGACASGLNANKRENVDEGFSPEESAALAGLKLSVDNLVNLIKKQTEKHRNFRVSGKSLDDLIEVEKKLKSFVFRILALVEELEHYSKRLLERHPGAKFAQAAEKIQNINTETLLSEFEVTTDKLKADLKLEYEKYFVVTDDSNFEQEVLKNDSILIVFGSAKKCQSCELAMPFLAKYHEDSGVKINHISFKDEKGQAQNPKITHFLEQMGIQLDTLPLYVVFIKGQATIAIGGVPASVEDIEGMINDAKKEYEKYSESIIPA